MADFELLVRGPEDEAVGRVDLECDDVAEAMRLAASLVSPYGHELLVDGRFLGRFEAGWGDHLDDDELEEA
ncbi:hypothetical protein [Phenylobacterium sp.]|uniref:hypothetical protein n=1 Tax=Phenylobacterium sp. TaxID=1871053 RepID=UPI0035B4B785